MRDKKRIKKILQKIESLWEEEYDLRFMQLLTGIIKPKVSQEHFYLEDEDFEKMLDKMIDRRYFEKIEPECDISGVLEGDYRNILNCIKRRAGL